ncbi:unnamed protein product [Soboliphyme baturini]|uniref:Protein AAR2 homolog n=1 Tax=Soboliphyme baturini TaxID=241478 RepID=A0A183IWY4_9BILA|nr:unnamed protein product [Soboliphyme baturini]
MSLRKKEGDEQAMASLQMDQDTARRLFAAGGVLLLLDLPKQSEFGVDCNAWTIGPKFKGLKMIPPGLHLIYVSAASKEGHLAPRVAFFHNFREKEVLVKKWDSKNEELIAEDDLEIVNRFRLNLLNLDPFLAPYPFQNHRRWYSLSYDLNEQLVGRLQPANKLLSSQAEFISKEFDELGESSMKVDRQHPTRIRYSDKQGLPILLYKEGTEVRFTSIPTPRDDVCSIAERTERGADSSYALQSVLASFQNPNEILGELQFAFICFLLVHMYEGFEQWKLLIHLLCNCLKDLEKNERLFLDFIMVLHYQLKFVPKELFVDIVSKNNFLSVELANFFDIVNECERCPVLKEKARKFHCFLIKNYRWDFKVDDDYKPVIVDSEQHHLS